MNVLHQYQKIIYTDKLKTIKQIRPRQTEFAVDSNGLVLLQEEKNTNIQQTISETLCPWTIEILMDKGIINQNTDIKKILAHNSDFLRSLRLRVGELTDGDILDLKNFPSHTNLLKQVVDYVDGQGLHMDSRSSANSILPRVDYKKSRIIFLPSLYRTDEFNESYTVNDTTRLAALFLLECYDRVYRMPLVRCDAFACLKNGEEVKRESKEKKQTDGLKTRGRHRDDSRAKWRPLSPLGLDGDQYYMHSPIPLDSLFDLHRVKRKNELGKYKPLKMQNYFTNLAQGCMVAALGLAGIGGENSPSYVWMLHESCHAFKQKRQNPRSDFQDEWRHPEADFRPSYLKLVKRATDTRYSSGGRFQQSDDKRDRAVSYVYKEFLHSQRPRSLYVENGQIEALVEDLSEFRQAWSATKNIGPLETLHTEQSRIISEMLDYHTRAGQTVSIEEKDGHGRLEEHFTELQFLLKQEAENEAKSVLTHSSSSSTSTNAWRCSSQPCIRSSSSSSSSSSASMSMGLYYPYSRAEAVWREVIQGNFFADVCIHLLDLDLRYPIVQKGQDVTAIVSNDAQKFLNNLLDAITLAKLAEPSTSAFLRSLFVFTLCLRPGGYNRVILDTLLKTLMNTLNPPEVRGRRRFELLTLTWMGRLMCFLIDRCDIVLDPSKINGVPVIPDFWKLYQVGQWRHYLQKEQLFVPVHTFSDTPDYTRSRA